MNRTASPVAAIRQLSAVADITSAYASTLRFLQRTAGPFVDLAIRLWLAQMFFVSAVLKLANWDTALYLATHEYPVSWLAPVTAAYVGVAIEGFGAIAIATGLATRVGAACLLLLACVIQLNYRALDVHLFWIALCGWYVVRGAGPLSLDRLLMRGLADSALPIAAPVAKAYATITAIFGPVYQLLLRLWAGAAIIMAWLWADGATAMSFWLPLASAGEFSTSLEVLLAVLLIAGLATRVAALGLIVLSSAVHLMGSGYANYGYWLMLCALFATYGAGGWSLDALIDRALRRRFPQLDGKPAFSLAGLPRVVVIGAGFGGLRCAADLARARVAVTLVDRHNYHLFQPLLYQVATASLSPGDIATPIRGLFREQHNVRVLLGEVTGVDSVRQEVLLQDRRLPYDYLVVATGAAHGYFGHDEWAPYAPGLKRVEDATEIRRRLLFAFERAEATENPEERQSLLTFLVVGGGPTGVELAGAIAELAKFGMEKEFRRFDPASARILLVQAAPRLLPTFPEALSEVTRKSLETLGVEVLLNSRVEMIDDRGVRISGRRIRSHTVLWAAGVTASPAAKWLGREADAAGRVKVGPDLTVPGLPNVFVVGDTALSNAWNGKPVPGLAPAAKQGGAYVARRIRAKVEGHRDPGPFVYRHVGSLATIGRKAAVVDFGFLTLHGSIAWWFWGAMHVGFLIGLRNRISVMFDWMWSYLTFTGGTRLITGGPESPPGRVPRPELRRVAVS